MTKDDAKKFPIMASATLFSLYLVFKYFNETVVKEVIFVYLLIVSCCARAGCLNLVLENYLPRVLFHFQISWRTLTSHCSSYSMGDFV